MHSYIQDGDTWVVIFYLPHTQEGPPRHAINVVKRFAREIDAARYAAFLNGGDTNKLTAMDIIDRGIE